MIEMGYVLQLGLIPLLGVVTIQEAGIESLPFDDEYFDKVFTVHTIYFWESIDQGFHEAYRVLKPGGTLYVSIMNETTMQKVKRTSSFSLFTEKTYFLISIY
jgi:ubiquinone/menaquinone biosynthesis C-methylase UbiE